VWAVLPDSILHSLGVTYYPNRYWAIAIPVLLMVTLVFSFIIYFALNLMSTESIDSIYTITDNDALPPAKADEELQEDNASIPPISDIPITVVNELLYGKASLIRMKRVQSYPTLFQTGNNTPNAHKSQLVSSN